MDGEIDADYYRKKSAQWREQIAQITDRITQYQRTTRTYTAEGLQVFEYAVSAQSMFESADSVGKRKLLKFVLSNSKFDDEKIVAKFRNLFDLPDETNTAVTGLKGPNGTIQVKTEGWRRGRDSNPRDGCPPTRFPGVRLRPLGHLSCIGENTTLSAFDVKTNSGLGLRRIHVPGFTIARSNG